MRNLAVVLVLGSCLSSRAAFAAGLSGEWSYRALNSGDSNFRAQQRGTKVSFYRVMHPEFEGERYLLEHIYRGQLQGKNISGKLFVREDGRGQFEPLRDFSGRVLGPDRIELDDMPLHRVAGRKTGQGAQNPLASAGDQRQETPSAHYRRVVIKRPGKSAQSPQAAGRTGPARGTDVGAEKPTSVKAPPLIPKLVRVARRLAGSRAEAERLMLRGDELFAGKHYADAAGHYRRALRIDPAKVEVLYKLGWSHGSLGVLAERAGDSEGARRHYRLAVRFWRRALRYDPYNRGARENIRRARAKLTRLAGK